MEEVSACMRSIASPRSLSGCLGQRTSCDMFQWRTEDWRNVQCPGSHLQHPGNYRLEAFPALEKPVAEYVQRYRNVIRNPATACRLELAICRTMELASDILEVANDGILQLQEAAAVQVTKSDTREVPMTEADMVARVAMGRLCDIEE